MGLYDQCQQFKMFMEGIRIEMKRENEAMIRRILTYKIAKQKWKTIFESLDLETYTFQCLSYLSIRLQGLQWN